MVDESLKVTDAKMAKIYATELINNIFGYTIGTNFMVKAGSKIIALK